MSYKKIQMARTTNMKNLLSGLGANKLKTDFSKQSKITLIGCLAYNSSNLKQFRLKKPSLRIAFITD